EFSRMAAAVAQRDGFRQAALPVMRELTMQAGESVWLALYDKEQQRISYIAESESPHASRYLAPLGRTKGMYDSACGLAILSRLPPAGRREAVARSPGAPAPQLQEMVELARHAGYAVLRANEVGAGMMVGAAVLDRDGQPIGSLGIIVPIHRYGA